MLPPNMTEPNETPKYTCALTNLLGKENELVRILQDRSFVEVKMSFCFVEFWVPSRNCQESRKQTVRLQPRRIEIVTDV